MSIDRIDVHTHVVPPFWAEALPRHGGDPSGWSTPHWSPSAAIDFMDSLSIQTSVLSLTAPGVSGWQGGARRDIARKVNEYTAGLVVQAPSRFGHFATLPLPDIEGALKEAEFALDVLKADGIILLSNYEDRYLGDALFEPLWQEFDRRGSTVFIHPGKPAIGTIDGMPGPMVDYPFDTTRTAVHLVLKGVLARYPNVRIILSHAGGFVPYAASRFAEIGSLLNPSASSASLIGQFKRFYFDTALSGSATTMAALEAFAAPGHILFGSDFPYAPAAVGRSFTQQLDGFVSSDSQRTAIHRANALTLFPRLSSRQQPSPGVGAQVAAA